MSIEQELNKKLSNKVAKEIDLDAIAKRLAPKMAKAIERNIIKCIEGMDECDFQDTVWEALPHKELEAHLRKRMIVALKK